MDGKLNKKQKKAQEARHKLKNKKQSKEVEQKDLPEEDILVDNKPIEEEAYAPIDDDKEEKKAQKEKQKLEKAESDKKQKKRKREEEEKDSEEIPGFVKKNALSEAAKNAKKKRKGGEARFITFVGNLPYDITVEGIVQHFNKCGEVPEVRLLTNKVRDDGKWQAKSKGAAFLEWNTVDALQKALKYHHTHLGKRSINVELSAGGGGKSQNRMQKISARNKDLDVQRSKIYNKKIGPAKEAHKAEMAEKGGKARDSTTSGAAPKPKPAPAYKAQAQAQSVPSKSTYKPSGANNIPLG
ncbi:hypothetical protein E3Q18_04386 [Wallemia mellicola]|uniref:RRM domain-containing protein n=1 Tax=Wallemia mellicola TaxID=1708541 RepID=A0AB74K948_9BASI|nr:hypothetical protein E3Q24_04378 [Wallemia mellicola]TIB78572.1 hypothetical protein E3Q21_04379 [Wallemia mellicola]TIB82986.1 hypothetical protein E3Q20_04357 [Wallemia mellicola]TIB93960.1 hypothetical protein E3Q18_04386 [Wallemia mellicola]TIC18804.1 hypothetical protein E3Q12_04394 [Wallemia mellicola]